MSDPFYLPNTRAVLSVLVVDDDLLIQRLLVAALHRLGHVVAVVDSGQHMLDRLANGPVDVVLLDVAMPGVDGLSALATLRQREAVGTVRRQYVVMVTGHAQDGDLERQLHAGADAAVAKPVRLPALAAALAGAARSA